MEYDIKETQFGTKIYYKKGTHIYHREDGPAIEFWGGDKVWYKNGLLHREDGPAFEDKNGIIKEWYINGKRLSPEKEELLNCWWNNKNGI